MCYLVRSTQVPLLVRAPRVGAQAAVYPGPVELVDLYPTLAALAGLPPPPAAWALPGVDLSPALWGGPVAKAAAFSQITRCWNCTLAYGPEAAQCQWDAAADEGYAVPCALAPRQSFDFMGMAIRTAGWRYSTFCAWDGARLAANFSACVDFEVRETGG